MKLRHFVPAFIFLLIAVAMMLGNDLANKPNFKHDMVGKQIPVFETTLLGSQQKITDKDLVKKPSIVNFFASWCIACAAEHKYLLKLKDEGFPIYGINSGDMPDDAQKYLTELHNPYHKVAYDPRRKLAVAFGTTGMPETFVVDTKGIIVYHYRGALNDDILVSIRNAYKNTK